MSGRAEPAPGIVYLVGAGPGDTGLITVRGLDCLRRAEVLVYDRLVGERLLDEAPSGCERVDAGKASGRRGMDQAAINALLVAYCRAGRRVVRLKGGDPFVFGRGGEEAAALAAAGLPFEIVPGVSSAVAVPAYAGIPLTHRGVASSFQVITGHEDLEKPGSALAWQHIAPGHDTLVVLMGVERLPIIARRLIEHGRPPTTPAAVIQQGTLPQQATVVGTLADIAERAAAAGCAAPAVIVVGEVVRLREQVRWFDNRPLFGKRVLVARSRAQRSGLSEQLAALGAVTVEAPRVLAAPPSDAARLSAALDALAGYDWVIFTSLAAVEAAFRGLNEAGRDARAFGAARVAAAGPGTAAGLAARGIRADVTAIGSEAERLLEPLAAQPLAGRRVLLLASDAPHDGLIGGLTDRGARVEPISVYRLTTEVEPAALHLIRSGGIDAVALPGSGAVRNLAAALAGDLAGLERAAVVAIGPSVAATARSAGFTVAAVAHEYDVPGLVAAVVEAVGQPRRAAALV